MTNTTEDAFIANFEKNEGLLLYYGYILVLMWAGFGLFFMAVTYCVTRRNLVRYAPKSIAKTMIQCPFTLRNEMLHLAQIAQIRDPRHTDS